MKYIYTHNRRNGSKHYKRTHTHTTHWRARALSLLHTQRETHTHTGRMVRKPATCMKTSFHTRDLNACQ